MAQDPLKPQDNGAVSLPTVDAGMNRVAPKLTDPADQRAKNPMMKPGGKKRDGAALLAKIRKRFDRCVQAESELRKLGLEDDKFYLGDQWPSEIVAQRSTDKRPCLTFNKFPTFVHQVTNDQRQNRPAININPVGDRGDPEGAKMFAGLIRSIERESQADIAYDTGYESACRKGWGYWRIVTEWAKPEGDKPTFDQELRIKRIRNAYTVYLDPDHQEPDAADIRYGFITDTMPRSEFEDDYPDADPMPFTQAGAGDTYKNWIQQNTVRVAEYYEIENEKRTVVMLDNGFVGWKDQLPENHPEIISEREADCPKVMWYKVTAKDILDEKEHPGSCIPIVKVIGDEIDVEGKVTLSGIVRYAKDAQRAYNFWRTCEAETIALAPKAPFIVAEGQDEGYENEWQTANNRSYSVLHYRPVSLEGQPVPGPSRQPPVQIPAGFVNAAAGAAQDMMATTGIRFDATPHERMYDESGRALRELRRSGDIGSFHLVDNLARSLKRTGEILVDLIPKVYERKRIVMILREGDREEKVEINPELGKATSQRQDERTGKTLMIFNPSFGQYGVAVTVGPSYATKRIEAAESMMDFLRAVGPAAPQAVAAVLDLIAKNQDWPGADEFTTRLAKVVAKIDPSLMQPDMKDVPPQVQALLASMQQQVQALMQERAALMKQLTDENADRALTADAQNKDFEARLLKIVADIETKFAALDQKRQQTFTKEIGAPLVQLAEGVAALRDALRDPRETDDGAAPAIAPIDQPPSLGGGAMALP